MLFILNFVVVIILLYGAVGKVTSHWLDRILTVATLFWAIAVSSGLVLSFFSRLGEPFSWLVITIVLSISLWFLFRKSVDFSPGSGVTEMPHRKIFRERLRIVLLLLLSAGAILYGLNTFVAVAHPPNNWDANTYHLPRAFFYMGQGTFEHFQTVNLRQVFFGFNSTTLLIWMLSSGLAEPFINLVNPVSLAVCFLGVYRLSRLCGASVTASLVAALLGALAPQVFAQGSSMTNDIQMASLLVCSAVFLMLFLRTQFSLWGYLCASAFGIALGIKLTAVFYAPVIAMVLVWTLFQYRIRPVWGFVRKHIGMLSGSVALIFWFSVPFVVANYYSTGQLMTDHYDYLKNKPFAWISIVQTAYTFLVQIFVYPFSYIMDRELLDSLAQKIFFSGWNPAYAFNPLKVITPGFSENSVFFGFAPYLVLGAFLYVIGYGMVNRTRDRKSVRLAFPRNPSGWFLLAALFWFLSYCAVGKWGMFNQRYFISAFLLALPAVAVLVDAIIRSRHNLVFRSGLSVVFAVAVFSLFTSSGLLIGNTDRSLRTILSGEASRILNVLPRKLEREISDRTQVNVVQYSWQHEDERHYPYMRMASRAKFSPRQFSLDQFEDREPEVLEGFNLLSFWAATEGIAYPNIPSNNSWIAIPVKGKRHPGVESVGTVGVWPFNCFRYFVFEPESAGKEENRNILFMAMTSRGLEKGGGGIAARLKNFRLVTVGLQEGDGLICEVYGRFSDGSESLLWECSEDGFKDVAVDHAFTRLWAEFSDSEGAVRGRGEINSVAFKQELQAADIPQFDPVYLATPQSIVETEGLSAPEGPFPMTGVPRCISSQGDEVSFTFNNADDFEMESLFLDLEYETLRSARIGVSVNGKRIVEIPEQELHRWFWVRTELPLREGSNTIVLQIVPLQGSPEIGPDESVFRFSEIKFRGVPISRFGSRPEN